MNDTATTNNTDIVAKTILSVVCTFPGYMGRTKLVRVLRGLDEPHYDVVPQLRQYACAEDWKVRDVAALVDAMFDAGLVALTPGARPTFVLTRAGFRALDAIEHGL